MNNLKDLLTGLLLLAAAVLLYIYLPWAEATLSSTRFRTVCATGDGFTTDYTIGFTFQSNTELKVYLVDNTSLQGTEIFNGTAPGQYQVTPDPATVIAFNTPPTSSQHCVFFRHTPRTQNVDYDENSAFPAEDHEEQMDRVEQQLQELDYEVSSKIGFSTFSTTTVPTFPEPIADRFPVYNHSGTNLTYAPSLDITLANGDILKYESNGWSVFNLSQALVGVTSNSFESINTPNGTQPVADGATDTLNVTSADNTITITGTAATDTVDYVVGTNLTNANLSSGASIVRSKIGTGTTNNLVTNNQAGLLSELAIGAGQFPMGNAAAVPTAVSASSDFTFNVNGVANLANGVIDNARVSGSARIQRKKLDNGLAFAIVSNDSSGAFSEIAPGAPSTVLISNGTQWAAQALGSAAGGTVTSVGLSVVQEMTVSSSPITTNGTIQITKRNQLNNTVWAGAGSGAQTVPEFRSLVNNDLPTVDVPHGGTGRATLTSNNLLSGNTAGTVNLIAPGTNKQVLVSNGTTWGASTLTPDVYLFSFSFGGASESAGDSCTANPCTIYRQRDSDNLQNTIIQIRRSNTGTYKVDLNPGKCSTLPTCAFAPLTNTRDVVMDGAPTTVLIPVAAYSLAGAAADGLVGAVCQCAK